MTINTKINTIITEVGIESRVRGQDFHHTGFESLQTQYIFSSPKRPHCEVQTASYSTGNAVLSWS